MEALVAVENLWMKVARSKWCLVGAESGGGGEVDKVLEEDQETQQQCCVEVVDGPTRSSAAPLVRRKSRQWQLRTRGLP